MKKLILATVTTVLILQNNMAQKDYSIYNPFAIDIDPMERLLLVNFEKDPDTLYIGFEPQVFNDEINGSGNIVIGWRVDGKVDVYHQPGMTLTPGKYNIAGKGLANMVEREMPGSYSEVNEAGVQAFLSFHDIHDRKVHIKISESNPRKRKPFGLLAPMGHAAENPPGLPFVLMHDFYFVRKKHTVLELSIDGREHKTDPFPIPIDRTRMTFMRYSPNPLIATINETFEGKLVPLTAKNGWNEIGENTFLELGSQNGLPVIKTLKRKHKGKDVAISFEPGFPDIGSLQENSKAEGMFRIMGDPSTGYVSGKYIVEIDSDGTRISMVPVGGWKPKPDRFSLRLLYRMVKIFRTWPTTYEWTATVIEDQQNELFMQSSWQRK